jgi:tRNA pseudouridine38/39 synthase
MDKYHHIDINELTQDQLFEIVQELRQSQQQKQQQDNQSSTSSSNEQVVVVKQNNNNQQQKKKTKAPKKKKEFDWSKAKYRHIALKIAYIGVNYQGFAAQTHVTNTVEAEIFKALKQTKIIESETTCSYSRCGRTDKGVSALCQVIGIKARSTCKENTLTSFRTMSQVTDSDKTEMDYVKTLNNVLPDDIRALSWAPVSSEFDARFGCIYRTYKYFFVRGDLDIEAMRTAANYYIGYHDFSNFCKINVGSVKSFKRKMLSIDIQKSPLFHNSLDIDEKHAVYEFIVCGYSFLWHQIRCMIAVLFHVGRGEEKPEIIQELLDVDRYPRRPQYMIASEYPLLLYDCVFEDVKWISNRVETPHEVALHFFNMWKDNVIKNTVINTMLSNIYSSLVQNDSKAFTLEHQQFTQLPYVPLDEIEFHSNVQYKQRGPKYVPLLQRPTGASYEEKLALLNNKKKDTTAQEEDPMDEDGE